MKQIILSLPLAFLAFSSTAQTFTIPNDTVEATVYTSLSMHNDITNTSGSDIQVSWRVTDHNLPADWASTFAICDNNLCYYNINNSLLGGNSFSTDPIAPSATGNFYVLPDLTNATTTGTYFVQIRMSSGPDSKFSWYIINKFPTSISVVKESNASLLAFPNPATDILILLINDDLNAEYALITNVQGQVVSKEPVTGASLSVGIKEFASGLYFVKVLNSNGSVLGTSKFIKE